jgi:hypothetical protein
MRFGGRAEIHQPEPPFPRQGQMWQRRGALKPAAAEVIGLAEGRAFGKARPPIRSAASITITLLPAAISRHAAAIPAAPAPITTTSGVAAGRLPRPPPPCLRQCLS